MSSGVIEIVVVEVVLFNFIVPALGCGIGHVIVNFECNRVSFPEHTLSEIVVWAMGHNTGFHATLYIRDGCVEVRIESILELEMDGILTLDQS